MSASLRAIGPSSDAQPKPSTGAAFRPVLFSDDLVMEDEMTPFGAVALMLALIHDFWMPDSPAKPFFTPWGVVALGFYGGIDMVVGGVAEAWDKARDS